MIVYFSDGPLERYGRLRPLPYALCKNKTIGAWHPVANFFILSELWVNDGWKLPSQANKFESEIYAMMENIDDIKLVEQAVFDLQIGSEQFKMALALISDKIITCGDYLDSFLS